MPSDANGVYSLPNGYLAVTGETIQASQHNPPLEDLASSMSARLMRSGAAPMTGPLKIVDGTVGAPSVQFANGSSTGLYKTTNGIGVAIGGTKVAEFGLGGMVSGSRWIGELVPFTGSTAPGLTVFPYGQTLSRTIYADLWAFAQVEIAAGNTFYNNGDGSTTFGIGDLRGRVPAAKNNMGGTSSGRLGSGAGFSSFGGADPNIIGVGSGSEIHTLTLAQLATGITGTNTNSFTVNVTETSGFTPYNPGSSSLISAAGGGVAGGISVTGGFCDRIQSSGTVSSSAITFQSNNTGGGAHNNVQPTIITNYVLFAGA
jgi:microcystin-dependent protein